MIDEKTTFEATCDSYTFFSITEKKNLFISFTVEGPVGGRNFRGTASKNWLKNFGCNGYEDSEYKILWDSQK